MRIAVAGAGGHAKVVADALLAGGSHILGYPVLGPLAAWSNKKIDGVVVAVGENASRKLIFEQLLAAGATPVSVVHPRALLGRGVRLGRGVVALANVVVNAGSSIGDNVILNPPAASITTTKSPPMFILRPASTPRAECGSEKGRSSESERACSRTSRSAHGRSLERVRW